MQDTVLTIAGSDSSGGAGVAADLKAIAANGGYGALVITAITAQNTCGVTRIEPVSPQAVASQIEAVFSDLSVAAVKTGMLATEPIVLVVAEALRRHRPAHLVCDPVMSSETGAVLLSREGIDALRRHLLPLATLVTPNVREAGVLAGYDDVKSLEEAGRAGRKILELGPGAVLVKGGHLEEAPGTDVLVMRDGCERLTGDWVDTPHTHGTGCTYSAAIATQLARGLPLVEAIAAAKRFVTEAIRAGFAVGKGPGATDPFFFLKRKGEEAASWLARLQATEAGRP